VLELKLRLLAGKVPTLRKYAHQQNLGNIEDGSTRLSAAAITTTPEQSPQTSLVA